MPIQRPRPRYTILSLVGLSGLVGLALTLSPTTDREVARSQDLAPRAEQRSAPAAAERVLPEAPRADHEAPTAKPIPRPSSADDAAVRQPLPEPEPSLQSKSAAPAGRPSSAQARHSAIDSGPTGGAPRAAGAEPAAGGPALAKVGYGDRDLTVVADYSARQWQLLQTVDATDPAGKQAIAAGLVLLEQQRQNQLRRLARERNIPFQEVTAAGHARQLVGLRDGEPVYLQTTNDVAAETTAADRVRRSTALDPVHGAQIDGRGLRVQIHDVGLVWTGHEEFRRPDGSSRVSYAYPETVVWDHATHVTGTILAAGKDPDIQGMAPAAEAISLTGINIAYMDYLAMGHPYHSDQTLLGNASLGFQGTEGGGYTSEDALLDELARSHPYFLMFFAAGNVGHNGWDSIQGQNLPKEAKSSITIGSVVDTTRDASGAITSGATISNFSSLGPSDDGRIAPDLVANGQTVESTSFNWIEDPPYVSSTEVKNGTSMACPNAVGSALLLQDYHGKLFSGTPMPAQTLKALLIHTADDLGIAGPDYTHGWGLVDTHTAALILRGTADGSMPGAIGEGSLADGATFQRRFTWDGTSPLRATCVWWDPALPEERHVHDEDDRRDPHLVNDLDLRLIAPDNSVHRPFVMPYVTGGFAEADLTAAATTGDNTTDNVEMVVVENPTQSGTWTLEVSHKGSLSGGDQPFSLILTGAGSAGDGPQITGVEPARGIGRILDLTVSGEEMQAGSSLRLIRGATVIAASIGARELDGDHLARFDLRGAATGAWDLAVTNPDGTSHRLAAAFQLDPIVATYLEEDFEGGFSFNAGWTSSATLGSDRWQVANARSASGDHSLHVPASESASDSWIQSPTVALDAAYAGALQLVFEQYAATEANFDGVVCEIQVDGGAWEDITAYGSFLVGGYTSALYDERIETPTEIVDDANPLAGRAAWHARSGGWTTTIVDLDPALLAGSQVAFRWRHGSDGRTAQEGWYLDDVLLHGEPESGSNQPPLISSSGITPTPVTGSSAQLLVTASDPDGDPLAYQWTVTDAPAGATPIIGAGEDPSVAFDTAGTYAFTVEVVDGRGGSDSAVVAVEVLQTATQLDLAP